MTLGNDYDVVIVGTGAAGLTAALHTFPLRTLVITKTQRLESGSTPWAQGGISFPVDEKDIPSHIKNTLDSGAGLCRPEAVDVLVKEAPLAQQWLEALGYPFDRKPGCEGSHEGATLLRGREGGHSVPRILHAGGDASGKYLTEVLLERASQVSNITLARGVTSWEIITSVDQKQVQGLKIWSAEAGIKVIRTNRIIFAGGGLGQVFGRTSNPREATGDCLAMGMEAGVETELLEMVQFHPTGLDLESRDSYPLLTEALRGAGARLVLDDGSDLKVDHPLGVLGTRDLVSRAVFDAQLKGHKVYMDARELPGPAFPTKFPSVFLLCKKAGLNPLKDLLPITPVVHYHMGGIKTDVNGRTSLPGLWAVGECASSGVHGGNRLASNSLLECLVFGRRAGLDVGMYNSPETEGEFEGSDRFPITPPTLRGNREQRIEIMIRLQKIVFTSAGPLRSEEGMKKGIENLQILKGEYEQLAHYPLASMDVGNVKELDNLFLIAESLLESALIRKESLGAHWLG